MDLLQVVDDHEGHLTRVLLDPLDDRPHRLDVRVRPAGTVDVQPLAIALQRLNRLGPALGAGEPFLQGQVRAMSRFERLTDTGQHDRSGTGDLGSLQDNQPLQHGLGVVLEGEVDRVTVGGEEVADHLQGEGGLAQTRRTTQEGQLTGAKTAAQRHVQGTEPGRPDLACDGFTRLEPPVGLVQNTVQRL